MRDAAIVDTNVLVYRYDYRFPQKQARATEVLQQGVERGYVIPHQALLEFVSVVSLPLPPNGERLLAERFDYPLLLSEDFQHRRFYGRVQAVNPFL